MQYYSPSRIIFVSRKAVDLCYDVIVKGETKFAEQLTATAQN